MTWNPPDMLGLGDFTWPVSFRYLISAPWGASQQELTVEAPGLMGLHDETVKLGLALWSNALAPASSRSLRLDAIQTMAWQSMLMPSYTPFTDIHGTQWGPSTDRSSSAVLSLLTTQAGGHGHRRLYLPAIPSGWVSDGLLTREGAENVQSLGRGIAVGLLQDAGASSCYLLNAYPRALATGPLAVHDVGFRVVTHIRVNQYTERMPSPGPATWPH